MRNANGAEIRAGKAVEVPAILPCPKPDCHTVCDRRLWDLQPGQIHWNVANSNNCRTLIIDSVIDSEGHILIDGVIWHMDWVEPPKDEFNAYVIETKYATSRVQIQHP